jgi:putative DNA-invertase from lambdoid prophage Rac
MEPARTRACLYYRVSKGDGSQTTANQYPEVQQIARDRGLDVVAVYEDHESAVRRRPQFEKLMLDARRGAFKVVVVWSLDRLGRGFGAFDAFRTLSSVGVRVLSCREPWTEAQGPALDLLVSVMSWSSGFERERLVERTRAGLERARRQGRRIGRPRVVINIEKAIQLREQGLGLRSAAAKLGVGASTLGRLLRAYDAVHRGGAACADTGVTNPGSQLPGITMAA